MRPHLTVWKLWRGSQARRENVTLAFPRKRLEELPSLLYLAAIVGTIPCLSPQIRQRLLVPSLRSPRFWLGHIFPTFNRIAVPSNVVARIESTKEGSSATKFEYQTTADSATYRQPPYIFEPDDPRFAVWRVCTERVKQPHNNYASKGKQSSESFGRATVDGDCSSSSRGSRVCEEEEIREGKRCTAYVLGLCLLPKGLSC
jgi:hypothetical protein